MRLLCFLALLLCHSSFAQVFIRNTTVIDVESKKLLPNQDVWVQDGHIVNVGKNLVVPTGAQIIDGSGKWLMPGLVDAHVHFFQSGGLYARPDAIDLRQQVPYAKEVEWTHQNMENFLRRYTKAGITTVIDVGATQAFLQQRDSFSNKAYAPTVLMTGPLLTTYEPAVYKDLGADEPFWLMKTPEEARALVRKQLAYKPDFIKIWYIAAGRNKDSSARASLPLVQAVIDESHKAGLRVAVHATELTTARLAVEAGTDYLVHGVEDVTVDDAFVRLLKQKGTVLSPTLVVADNYNKVFGQIYTPTADDYKYANPTPLESIYHLQGVKDTQLVNEYRTYVNNHRKEAFAEDSLRMSNLKKLYAGGVIIATGTDAGNIGTQHVSSYFDELKAMQQSGMDMWGLLKASTTNGAKAMGKEKEVGLIKKGFAADLLLLTRNPLDSLRNWQSVEWVIKKGVAIKPDSVLRPTPAALADQQLAAYNAHNLEAFLEPYAENVEVYELESGTLQVKGKEAMRKQYAFLNNTKTLYCKLLNRIVEGNIVVDHEEILLSGGRKVYGMAIYQINAGKIVKVWFPK